MSSFRKKHSGQKVETRRELKALAAVERSLPLTVAEKRSGFCHYHCFVLLLRVITILFSIICLIFSTLHVYGPLSPYNLSHYEAAMCTTLKIYPITGIRSNLIMMADVSYVESNENARKVEGTAYICGYTPGDDNLRKCEQQLGLVNVSFPCLYSRNPLVTNTGWMRGDVLFTYSTLLRSNEMHIYLTMATVIMSSIAVGLHFITLGLTIFIYVYSKKKRIHWNLWIPHKTLKPPPGKDACEISNIADYKLSFSPTCSFENEAAKKSLNGLIQKNTTFFELMKWTAVSNDEEIIWIDVPPQTFLHIFNLTVLFFALVSIGIAVGVGGGIKGFPGLLLGLAAITIMSVVCVNLFTVMTWFSPYCYIITNYRIVEYERLFQYTSIHYFLIKELETLSHGNRTEFVRFTRGKDHLQICAFGFPDADDLIKNIKKRKDELLSESKKGNETEMKDIRNAPQQKIPENSSEHDFKNDLDHTNADNFMSGYNHAEADANQNPIPPLFEQNTYVNSSEQNMMDPNHHHHETYGDISTHDQHPVQNNTNQGNQMESSYDGGYGDYSTTHAEQIGIDTSYNYQDPFKDSSNTGNSNTYYY